jgi:protein-disulfide isomerase
MNRRNLVLAIAAIAIGGFALAAYVFNAAAPPAPKLAAVSETSTLIRPHSPVMGPADARVTIVEFFDPACETCRRLYPVVKQIMAEYPKDVRVVLRYAAFHDGSDQVVRMLEAARKQGVYVPVMEALLAAQPEWADHQQPNIEKAWAAAGAAGLNVDQARKDVSAPEITAVLTQDAADIETVGVKQTPTFFVNGKPLPSFGIQQLQDLVRSEVEAARKG